MHKQTWIDFQKDFEYIEYFRIVEKNLGSNQLKKENLSTLIWVHYVSYTSFNTKFDNFFQHKGGLIFGNRYTNSLN